MECKVGDRVRFMDDVGGGIVAKFIDKKTIAVRDEDGFEIPVSVSNVIVVQSDDFFQRKKDTFQMSNNEQVDLAKSAEFAAQTEEKNLQNEVKDPNYLLVADVDEQEGNTLSIYLGFVPIPSDENTYKVYLINDSSYRGFVVLSEYKQGNISKALWAGFIEADSKKMTMELSQDYFRKEAEWSLSFLSFKNVPYQFIIPDAVDIYLNPLKFFRQGCFQANEFFDEDALVLHVYESKVE